MNESAVHNALEAILDTLGEPNSTLHQDALEAYQSGDTDKLRLLAATNLGDHFCRSLGYAVSAKTKPGLPTVAVVLAESARAAADFAREREMQKLSAAIADALKPELATA
ncbi:MAG: hypothetical protein AAGF98_00325 [Cyanobacteria bacterium P01_H01_bin.153]